MTSHDVAEKHYTLSFYVRRCVKYHAFRSAFFSKLNSVTSFIGVLFGSAALTSIVAQAPVWISISASLVVTVFSALDLVIGTGRKAWEHNDFKKAYQAVELSLLELGESKSTEESLCALEITIKKIESQEPKELQFLNEMASNEVIRSIYPADEAMKHVVDLPWSKRVTANIIDWDVGPYISAKPT